MIQKSTTVNEVKPTATKARITMSLPLDLYAEVKAAAAADGRSVSNWLARAAAELLAIRAGN